MSFFDDLNNLDTNNIGGWPQAVKAFFAAIVFVVVLLLGGWFFIKAQNEGLESGRSKEEQLRKEFSDKQGKVVNLDAYKKQLEEMKDMLTQMLNQLPSKTEMPNLLDKISQTALASGIETELFQPGAESIKDFYAEKPIQLRMKGSYHQFGTFISSVASISAGVSSSRVVILTMHDVSLHPYKATGDKAIDKSNSSGVLMLEGTVKTYRYVDDDEAAAASPPTPGAKPGTKPDAKAGGGQ